MLRGQDGVKRVRMQQGWGLRPKSATGRSVAAEPSVLRQAHSQHVSGKASPHNNDAQLVDDFRARLEVALAAVRPRSAEEIDYMPRRSNAYLFENGGALPFKFDARL